MYLAFKNPKISSKKVNSGQKAKSKCKLCFSRLKCNKIGATDAITKNSRNNVVRRKRKTNKVARIIFRGFEVRKKVQLIF